MREDQAIKSFVDGLVKLVPVTHVYWCPLGLHYGVTAVPGHDCPMGCHNGTPWMSNQ